MDRKNVKFELRRFDISSIKDDSTIVLVGKRRTGKSFLTRDIMYYHTDIPLGCVISQTERYNGFYSDFVPNVLIHPKPDKETISNIHKRQDIIARKYEKEKKLYGGTRIDPRLFLILDDCLSDKNWQKSEEIREFFMNGRHLKLFLLITMQYPLGIPPELRTNIDYVFILKETILANKKRIYESYAGMFPTFELFCQVMDQCTQDYECLVIDTTTQSTKLEDLIFWYKGEKHEDFKLCSNEYWLNNNENDEEEEDEEIFSPDMFKKGRTPNINVKKL